MTEKIPLTIQLHPAHYMVMAKKADAIGVPLHHLIEASIAKACRPNREVELRGRQADIAKLHATGLNDRQIADRLGLTQTVVYYHRHNRLHLPKNDPRGGVNRHNKEKKGGENARSDAENR